MLRKRLAVAGMSATMMAVAMMGTVLVPRVDLVTKESRVLCADKNIDSISMDNRLGVEYSGGNYVVCPEQGSLLS